MKINICNTEDQIWFQPKNKNNMKIELKEWEIKNFGCICTMTGLVICPDPCIPEEYVTLWRDIRNGMTIEKFINILPDILICIHLLIERILLEDINKFFLERWSIFMLSNKAHKLYEAIDKMCDDGYFIKEQTSKGIYLVRN